MAIRIVDIAKLAGVSASTVSLVLNGKSGVGDETRSAILKMAGELGYVSPKPRLPEPAPRAPDSDKSICFLHIARHGHTVNRDHDVFIADYIEGLTSGARARDLALEIISFKSTPIERIIDEASRHGAAGIVVLGTELSVEDVTAFSAVRRPVVFIDTWHAFLDFDFVDMNNGDSVFTIVSYLFGLGHRRIGMVRSSVETRNFKLREEGFAVSLERLGLARDESLDFVVDPTFHGASEDMAAALRARVGNGHATGDRAAGGTGDSRTDGVGSRDAGALPTALFCGNDIIACGCLKALGEAGLRVPGDISVVGFDDLPLSAVVDPPLTTIQVSKARIGQMAVELLAARMGSDADSPPVKALVGGKLIVRESAGGIL